METTRNNSVYEDPLEDPFSPYEYEIGTAETIYKFMTEYLVFILHIILSIVILAISGIFVYAIFKFKRLQTRTNYILLNFFVCSSCYSVCASTISALGSYRQPIHTYHALNVSTFGTLIALILFAALLATDWFLLANCKKVFAYYKVIYKWIIGAVYIMILLYIIFFAAFHITSFSPLLCGLIYLVSSLYISVLNIIKCRKTYSQDILKTFYFFKVSNMFFLFWLPGVLIICMNIAIHAIYVISFPILVVLVGLTYALCLIALSAPIVIMYFLIKWDKNFRISYKSLLKLSVRSCVDSDSELTDNNYLDIEDSH